MKILGIDTSSEQVSVAVGDEESISASFQLASDRRHVESLIPAIELLLRNVGISIHELSAIAVDLGPGLFTGMRVGITTALTLSDIAELPLIGLDSLQVLAHGIEIAAEHRAVQHEPGDDRHDHQHQHADTSTHVCPRLTPRK